MSDEQTRRYPIVDPQSPKGRALQTIGNLLSPLYSNYLVFGSEVTAGESVTDVDKRFFDNVRANPFSYDLSQYSEYINENLGANYRTRYNAVRDLLEIPAETFNQAENAYQEQMAFQNVQREYETVPPVQQPVAPQDEGAATPTGLVGRQVIGGDGPTGMIGTRQIGGGATVPAAEPALATGAEDIEPGELARPGGTTGLVTSTVIEDGEVVSRTGPGAAQTGGGTGDGVATEAGDGVSVETPYADAVPADWEIAASEIYGSYYHLIKQEPEVAELIAKAAFEEWEPDKFQYQLEQTGWWRRTSASIREFENEYARDPATVQARIDALAAQIRQDALNLNVRLTGETLNQLATDAIRQGWTEQQVTNAIGMTAIDVGGAEGVTSLRYGYYGNKINEIAASYGVSISDTEFNQLVNKFAVGEENEQSLTSAFQTRATALFPALSERLMAGETFADIVEPYRNRASKILEQDFSASDFMDNDSFAQAVTYIGDDGKQRPMTYTEWGQYLRSNREFGYEYTSEAQSRAYQVANRIADIFGAI